MKNEEQERNVYVQLDLARIVRKLSDENKRVLFDILSDDLQIEDNKETNNNQKEENITSQDTKKDISYIIYTDGACSGNPGPGGWAWVRVLDGEIECSDTGKLERTTNNKAEYYAIYQAIVSLPKNSKATIYTDSNVAVHWFNGSALKAAKDIFDLHMEMENIIKGKNLKIKIGWMQKKKENHAHVRADILAKQSAGSRIR